MSTRKAIGIPIIVLVVGLLAAVLAKSVQESREQSGSKQEKNTVRSERNGNDG